MLFPLWPLSRTPNVSLSIKAFDLTLIWKGCPGLDFLELPCEQKIDFHPQSQRWWWHQKSQYYVGFWKWSQSCPWNHSTGGKAPPIYWRRKTKIKKKNWRTQHWTTSDNVEGKWIIGTMGIGWMLDDALYLCWLQWPALNIKIKIRRKDFCECALR